MLESSVLYRLAFVLCLFGAFGLMVGLPLAELNKPLSPRMVAAKPAPVLFATR